MTLSLLRQFVPSAFCLECRGCCRFQESQSPWRPKTGIEEAAAMHSDKEGYITTIQECGKALCRFLDPATQHCRIYESRPFECALYPFILSSQGNGIDVYVHLACPYIQEQQSSPELTAYIAYLREFFNHQETRAFLKANRRLIHDYTPQEMELMLLFRLNDMGVDRDESLQTMARPGLMVGGKQTSDIFEHKALFDQYLSQSAKTISAMHFSSIALWRDFFDFTFEIIDGEMCVFAHNKGSLFLYLPPFGGDSLSSSNARGGNFDKAMIEKVFARMNAINPRTARIENVTQEQTSLLPSEYSVYHKADEYVYRKADMIALQGNAYKSQRHDVNHVIKECAPHYRAYTPQDYQECVAVFERWAAHKKQHSSDDIYNAMLEENAHVHRLALQEFDRLGLYGAVVTVKDRCVAYSLGYRLNLDTFVVLLEVCDPTIVGLAAFIFKQFCADPIWSDCDYVNAMDDFGLENVKRTKAAYHPIKTVPIYTISRVNGK